jgi:1,1a-dihydroxy-1-hydro-9-fluorenone dehydrogenase
MTADRNSQHPDLKDRVVVVTGAARGMGRAFANAFLERGAKVVATDRSWDGTEPFPAGRGENVVSAVMDVTNDAQIDAAYDLSIARFGTVDVLINNAALRQRDLFPPTGRTTTLETKDSDWQKSFAVNVFGVVKVIRRFIRPMIEKRRGSIVNVLSSGILHHAKGGAYMALRPHTREMPYMSSKAALATMSFYLADEVQEHNIAVNTLIPTNTRTTGYDEQNKARMAQGIQVGQRTPVVPEHMVPLMLLLAAQNDCAVTGRMFDVMAWNIEHGLGGQKAWLDTSFSMEALLAG